MLFVVYSQHPPTSTTDLNVLLGKVRPSKQNYVTNQAAICEWAAGTGSPGTASTIYFNPVPRLDPHGLKTKNRPDHREVSQFSD